MKFLARERGVMEAMLPGLDETLAAAPFEKVEGRDRWAVEQFVAAGGVGLAAPLESGGKGCSALVMTRLQRAVGARAPSLAVASTMHHYKVKTLDVLLEGERRRFLSRMVERRWLIASCGAEGFRSKSLFEPTMRARKVEGGLVLTGSKKPCSLIWSMGVLSMMVRTDDGGLYNVLIPVDQLQLERRKFWNSPVLAATESDEVILQEALIVDDLLFELGSTDAAAPFTFAAFLWFELLISASYLGIASRLAEYPIVETLGSSHSRASLGIELETSMAALECIARGIDDGEEDEAALLERLLYVRYGVQAAIGRASSLAAELSGGGAFLRDGEVAMVLAATKGLSYHAPSREGISDKLAENLCGGQLPLI
ncbi:hypothetical protein [Halothiobacillus sp.]|uniref:hypothetical protein n=1 Tax=Halothiobacillus sp. TaxID=1891311 RepID=UPI00261F53E2|nr:hypothetical protein [Halothiobacillus sp.]MDD4965735.1 hypothetical protein [Halothiobacillus sp.]